MSAWLRLIRRVAFPDAKLRVALLWRRTTLRLSIAFCLALLVLAGLVESLITQGWLSTAINLSGNIAASGVVAAAAVAGFVAGTRRRAYARLLAHQRAQRRGARSGVRRREWLGLARAAVAQLGDPEQPAYLLVEAPDAGIRAEFLNDLFEEFINQSIAVVALSGDMLLTASPQDVVIAEFARLLSEAGAPNSSVAPVLDWLVRRRRVVVVIDGVDANERQVRRGASHEIISSRVDDMLIAKLPFVAIGEPGSTPGKFIVRHLVLPSPTMSSGTESDGLPDDHHEFGPLTPLVRQLTAISYLSTTTGLSAPGAAAMSEVAACLVRLDSKSVDWVSLTAAIPPGSADRFLSGINELEEAGLLRREVYQQRVLLRFRQPELRELVAGIWTARSTLPLGYAMRRGMSAFAGEILQRMLTGELNPDIWARAMRLAAEQGWLQTIGDVSQALAGMTSRDPGLDAQWLAESWTRAENRERIAFVSKLPRAVANDVTRFLWDRLLAQTAADTNQAVRRAIAHRLGDNGSTTWYALADDWRLLVRAAGSGGLAWHQRREPAWRRYGGPVSALCWVLPSVWLRCDDADRPDVENLLIALADSVCPGGGPDRDQAADIGIEISLGEGYKDMCTLASSQMTQVSDELWRLIRTMALRGASWVSKLYAFQSIVLLSLRSNEQRRELQHLCATLVVRRQHPLFREYVRYAAEAVSEDGAELEAVTRSTLWIDDTATLDRGGAGLADPCIQILAMTTLLLNMAEARIRSSGDWESQQAARVAALTSAMLPSCLSSRRAAIGSTVAECVCEMRLCGPGLNSVSIRSISPAFANRCVSSIRREAQSPTSRTLRTSLSAQALKVHMLRIARGTHGSDTSS